MPLADPGGAVDPPKGPEDPFVFTYKFHTKLNQ